MFIWSLKAFYVIENVMHHAFNAEKQLRIMFIILILTAYFCMYHFFDNTFTEKQCYFVIHVEVIMGPLLRAS